MQLRALGVTCTKVGLFFPYSQSSTLHAKIIFFFSFFLACAMDVT